MTIGALVLLVAAGSAHAAQPILLRGELGVRSAQLDGDVYITQGAATLLMRPMAAPTGFILLADEVVVNWTREDARAVGHRGGSGGALYSSGAGSSTGEDEFREASVHITFPDKGATMLLHSPAGLAGGVRHASIVQAPAHGVAIGRNQAQVAHTVGDDPLTHRERLDPAILLQSGGFTFVEAGPEVTLWIWGGSLAVVTADSRHQYASGTWTSNETITVLDPAGVIRDQHDQLLRIRMSNVTWATEPLHGPTRLCGSALHLDVDGRITLDSATGVLQSTESYFVLNSEKVSLDGRVGLDVTTDRETLGRLGVKLEGTVATLSVEPAGSLPHRTTLDDAWIVAAVIGVGGLLLAFLASRRYASRAKDPDLAVAAETALVRGDARRATRTARRLLAKDPDHEDAAFVLGASLVRRGRLRPAARFLHGFVERGTSAASRASFAFLLALANLRLGRLEVAAAWADKAAQDPEFLERMRVDPVFRRLDDNRRVRRSADLRDASPAYA